MNRISCDGLLSAVFVVLAACAPPPGIYGAPGPGVGPGVEPGAPPPGDGDGVQPDSAQPVVSATVSAGTGEVIPVNYTWRVGDRHTYDYREDAAMRMTVPMMGEIRAQFKIASRFDLIVEELTADGWAMVRLELGSLSISGPAGELATLASLPARARSVSAAISPRGAIVFAHHVSVAFGQEQAHVLIAGDGKIDHSRARVSASASANGETISVAASIDVQTGQVRAEATHTGAPPPVQNDDSAIDVFPRDLLELLVLPESDLTDGGEVAVTGPWGETRVTARRADNDLVSVHSVFDTDVAGLRSSADITANLDPGRGLLVDASGSVQVTVQMPDMQQTIERRVGLALVQ